MQQKWNRKIRNWKRAFRKFFKIRRGIFQIFGNSKIRKFSNEWCPCVLESFSTLIVVCFQSFNFFVTALQLQVGHIVTFIFTAFSFWFLVILKAQFRLQRKQLLSGPKMFFILQTTSTAQLEHFRRKFASTGHFRASPQPAQAPRVPPPLLK